MKVQVLVGPIASGKSSYCKKAARNGYLVLNDDSVVNLLHGGIYELYDKNLKVLYKSVENHIFSLALALKRSIVIDRGLNIDVNGRNRWTALSRSFDVSCEALVFVNEGPEIHAKRRFDSDSRGHSFEYWSEVAQAHHKRYKEPTLDEGFDSIRHVKFNEW